MSLPANDSLISGSTQSITAYSASWSLIIGAVNVGTSGAFGNSSFSDSGAFWNADVFPNDQYSQLVLVNGGGSIYCGPCVRASAGGGGNAYRLDLTPTSGTWHVAKLVGGAFTNLSGDQSGTFSNGDTLKLTAVGTTITAYQNGSVLYTTTDSSLASGSAGIYFYDVGNPPDVKTWQGGSLAVAAGATVAWLV
jgi:hypothetical protein